MLLTKVRSGTIPTCRGFNAAGKPIERPWNQNSAPIADKVLLTIPEAQALTGLSREILKEAIEAGDLPAKIMGKAYRIKRKDVDAYIDRLWLNDTE